jgi:hypothetical protein
LGLSGVFVGTQPITIQNDRVLCVIQLLESPCLTQGS